ncbi:ubiquinone biosynthesis monooxygenase Coq7 [Linderina macrospora]|uniref:Ubiquinone biosynthesis monooxygenase Coq7 n=1 Tax=Linderina macrospora TaxID=4868 RepID=A0ACC1J460_9FUNG|nr:ubiquinone biosynthesis monooxygenase Coq7 [Linderina macrospora]
MFSRAAATRIVPRACICRSNSTLAPRNPYLKEFKYKDRVSVKNGELTLSADEHSMIDRFVRVNQAGETAAVTIYKGQMAVLGHNPELRKLLTHMRDQEIVHLEIMDRHIRDFRVRPTLLQPVAAVGGYVLGMVTALMGVESAMTCTEAVETRIGNHYNDQLRDLHQLKYKELDELKRTIAKCRDEELEHLETAVEHGAKLAPLHELQFEFVKGGCSLAIWACERI